MLTLLLLPQFVWGELHIRKIAEIDKTGQVSPMGSISPYMDPDTGGLGLLNLRTLERRVLTDSHWPEFVQFSAFSADSRRESAVAAVGTRQECLATTCSPAHFALTSCDAGKFLLVPNT